MSKQNESRLERDVREINAKLDTFAKNMSEMQVTILKKCIMCRAELSEIFVPNKELTHIIHRAIEEYMSLQTGKVRQTTEWIKNVGMILGNICPYAILYLLMRYLSVG